MIVISQINLLLCLVNDILDLKMIEQGKFLTRKQEFNPLDIFKFIESIFSKTAQLQKTSLSFKPCIELAFPPPQDDLVLPEIEPPVSLPKQLIGDPIRLK